jgi:hypothetical protein
MRNLIFRRFSGILMTTIAGKSAAGFQVSGKKGKYLMTPLIRHPEKTKKGASINNSPIVFLNRLREPCNHFHFGSILSTFLCFVLSGCAFMALEKEVSLLNQTSILEGTISNPSPHKKP